MPEKTRSTIHRFSSEWTFLNAESESYMIKGFLFLLADIQVDVRDLSSYTVR